MDGTYAPQSPDLSSFLSSPSKTQQIYNPLQPQPQPQYVQSGYAPRSPVIPSFNTSSSTQHNLHAYNANQNQNQGFGGGEFDYDTQYMPPIPSLPPTHASFQSSYLSPQRAQPIKQDPYSTSNAYIPSTSPTMSSRGPRIKSDPSSSSAPVYKNPNPTNIEIKTKFPVARIKRIMQADEEVGKVAQVTPVAVSKALELFMISLVTGAAEKAKEKGGKKVTAQHLKAVVVASPEQFDFLNDIVGRIAENTEGAGGENKKRKGKEEGSESEEEEKKPKKGRGRRKKED